MERYNSDNTNFASRTEKNNKLYSDISKAEISRVKTSKNYRIIESDDNNIDINKIREYFRNIDSESPKRKSPFPMPSETNDTYQFDADEREYDINKVLSNAKEGRSVDYESIKYKKLHEKELDILKKLAKYEYNYQSDDNQSTEFNSYEQTLIDLINTIHSNKTSIDLLKELRGDDDTIVTKPIEEERNYSILRESEEQNSEKKAQELEKTKELVELKNLSDQNNVADRKNDSDSVGEVDKSFYTTSTGFSKEDFDGFDELEKRVKQNNILTTISLIILFLAIALTLVVIANFVFELGLF